jgi:hypothetical protein
MYRTATQKSIFRDRHFWKGAAMFGAGCVVMGLATSFASASWFSKNEQPFHEPLAQGEIGVDQALALWADFPVTAQPRPVVVVGPDYRPPDFGGERGDEKDLAFTLGRWNVPKRMTLPPRSADGYAIRYVGAVLEEMRANLERTASPEQVAAGLTLGTAEERSVRPIVTGAKLQKASFTTDRGVRSLPAWVVNFRGQDRPLVVLAIDEPNRFAAQTSEHAENQLRVSPDGLVLTYGFTGAPPGRGPCEAEYEPVVLESPTAVAVGARRYLAKAADETGCGPADHPRTVSIQLTQPLGERVVVTARFGSPMAPITARGKAS